MNFSYSKPEKLKSRTTIDLLFKKGESVSKFPVRMVYRFETEKTQPLEFGVSVSKRYFKKATDRNYYKRCLREAYRLKKHLLLEAGLPPLSAMLIYQTKDRLDFHQILEKTEQLFQKFIEKQSGKRDSVSE